MFLILFGDEGYKFMKGCEDSEMFIFVLIFGGYCRSRSLFVGFWVLGFMFILGVFRI